MKIRQIQELHQKTVDQLESLSQELSQQLAKAKLEKAVRRLENTSQPYHLRKDLARVKTVLTIKQYQAKHAAAKKATTKK